MIRSGMVRYWPALEPHMVDIDSVHPAPWNYNNGDVEEIMASIEENGMWQAVHVQASTRDIIMHNHVWMACKELGATIIPAMAHDVDDHRAAKMMIADNHTARLARPDPGLLLALVETEVGTSPEDLVGTGLTERDVRVLTALNEIPLDFGQTEGLVPFTAYVEPEVLKAFRYLTREADTDTQAFELLLRLAGWHG